MTTGRTLWFVIAGLCVAAAIMILGGRSILIEYIGEPWYEGLIICAYALLGAAAGALTKAFSIDRGEHVPDAH